MMIFCYYVLQNSYIVLLCYLRISQIPDCDWLMTFPYKTQTYPGPAGTDHYLRGRHVLFYAVVFKNIIPQNYFDISYWFVYGV